MATATYAQLKDWFARGVGDSDGSSIDTAGEALINDAHKELSSNFPFDCNKTIAATITLSSGSATLPADFDFAHKNEVEVYSYASTTKTKYTAVAPSEVSRFSSADYVYYIDEKNSALKSNQATGSLKLDYFAIPAVMTSDSDTTNFPVPKAVSVKAASDYYFDFEEDEEKAKRKFEQADLLFAQAKERNKLQREYGLKFRQGGEK